MDSWLGREFERVLERLFKVWAGLVNLLAFLVIIPLTLWVAWAHYTTFVDAILLTLFCLAFAWGLVSATLCFRCWRKLGLSGEGRLRLYSGPRPDDPDELRAWQLGWHFMYAIIAVMLCMVALPVASWLGGK